MNHSGAKLLVVLILLSSCIVFCSCGDDPVSTNQTLGGGGSSKGVVLNLAYVDWEAAEGLHLLAGKFKNPLTRVGKQPLMWDGDWTPEGIALTYKRDWFFANALGNYLESDSRRSNTTFSWGAQFGASGTLGGAKLKGGIGRLLAEDPGRGDDLRRSCRSWRFLRQHRG